jgi:hypothetical protein
VTECVCVNEYVCERVCDRRCVYESDCDCISAMESVRFISYVEESVHAWLYQTR